MEPALFWWQKDFFQGHWWQNEEKLKLAYDMLLKESESRHMTIITLAEDFDYYDSFGYANTRLYTLQELIGDTRTGVYGASTMQALQNVYLSRGIEADLYEPELTPDNLKVIWDWHDNENRLMRKGAYLLENGWGDVIEGSMTLTGAYYATRPVETSNINGNGNQSIPTEQEMHDAVEQWTKMEESLATKTQLRKFNTASVAYDSATGNYYYGMNRGFELSGDSLNPSRASWLPEQSLNYYCLKRCVIIVIILLEVELQMCIHIDEEKNLEIIKEISIRGRMAYVICLFERLLLYYRYDINEWGIVLKKLWTYRY